MRIDADLEMYLATNTRVTSDKTIKQYRCTFKQFCVATGAKKPKHVTDDRLGLFLQWMRSEGYAIHTQAQKLAYLLAYGRDRAKRGVCPWPTIKPPQLPDLSPTALTTDQISRLIQTAYSWPGCVGSVPAGLWWGSIVRWFWLTAERTEATLTGVRLANITGNVILIDAEYRKGRRKPMTYTLPESLIDEMREVQLRGVDNVWHWPCTISAFYPIWRTIYEAAGGTWVRYKTGPHQLRKSHATHLTAAGLDASDSLGHSNGAVTKRSYIDRRIAKRPDYGAHLPRVG